MRADKLRDSCCNSFLVDNEQGLNRTNALLACTPDIDSFATWSIVAFMSNVAQHEQTAIREVPKVDDVTTCMPSCA